MARSLNGSSDYLRKTSWSAATSLPISFSIWIYPTTLTPTYRIFDISTGSDIACLIGLHHTATLTKIRAQHYDGGADTKALVSSGDINTNAWNHAGAIFTSTTARYVWLNGSQDGPDTTAASAPSGLDEVYLGAAPWSVGAENFPGYMAEAGIWTAALSSDEMTALSKGLSPLAIRPQSLVAYWPLLGRATDEEDWVGGNTLTASGTSAVEHPRVIRPRSVRYFLGTAGVNAGVGATSGTSTVAALSGSVAAGAGTATATARSGNIARSDGAATASAVAGSVGASSGTSTASALAGAIGQAAGSATVTGKAGAIGQSAGTSTAAGVSASADGAGAAAGTSTVTGLAGSIGQTAGTSTAQAVSSASAAVGQSAGTSTAAAIAGSIAQASGTGTASGITSAAVGVGESAGTSNVIALSGSIGSAAGTGTAVALQGAVGTSSGTATVLAFRGSVAASAGSTAATAISGSVGECAGTTVVYAYSSASVAIGTAAGTSNVIAISGALAAAAGSAVAIAYSAGPPGDLPAFRSGAAGTRPTAAERRRPAARSRYGTA